jgi:hypothetical protein
VECEEGKLRSRKHRWSPSFNNSRWVWATAQEKKSPKRSLRKRDRDRRGRSKQAGPSRDADHSGLLEDSESTQQCSATNGAPVRILEAQEWQG